MVMAVIVMIASAFYAVATGAVTPVSDDNGTILPPVSEWISSPIMSLWANTGVILIIIAFMVYINKAYTIPRTITFIYATFFAVLQTATPEITARMGSGTLLAAIIMASMTLMFSVYSKPESRRRVFLVFFLLSSAIAVQYAFIVYIPVFIIACAQMRIFTLRTVLAALVGVITPWWLLFGAGIVTPGDFHLPHFVSVIEAADSAETILLASTIALTVVLTMTAYALSLLKLITYNARTRACNGLLTLLTVVTVIAMAADFTNFITYLTLLNCCSAFFLGHLFVIRNSPRAWVAIISIIIYYAIYIWKIFV